MKKLQKGFTLIELMIVVAIIGILAAVAIPAYQDYIIKAKLSKIQAGVAPIKLAIALFYQENGSFPGGNTVSSGAQVTTANQNTVTTDAYLLSLGFAIFPTLPNELQSMDIATAANSASTTIRLRAKSGGIKAGTCNATATPTAAGGIDGCYLNIIGTPGSSAMVWTYADGSVGDMMGNIIASKYFK